MARFARHGVRFLKLSKGPPDPLILKKCDEHKGGLPPPSLKKKREENVYKILSFFFNSVRQEHTPTRHGSRHPANERAS